MKKKSNYASIKKIEDSLAKINFLTLLSLIHISFALHLTWIISFILNSYLKQRLFNYYFGSYLDTNHKIINTLYLQQRVNANYDKIGSVNTLFDINIYMVNITSLWIRQFFTNRVDLSPKLLKLISNHILSLTKNKTDKIVYSHTYLSNPKPNKTQKTPDSDRDMTMKGAKK